MVHDALGGGIVANAASPFIRNNVMCRAGSGVGVYGYGSASPIIQGNDITDCYFGITGDGSPRIEANSIVCCSRAGLHLGGMPVVRGNLITGHSLVGIQIQESSNPDLGDMEGIGEPGSNAIYDNAWNVWNLTPNSIKAQGNYWGYQTTAEIDASIYDDDEDGSLGAVDFEPFLDAAP